MSALARVADALFAELAHVARGSDCGQLASIADPAINLAIWQRQLSPALAGTANGLLAAAPSDIRVTAPIAGVSDALTAAMAAAGWPSAPDLVADVADLAVLAGPLMRAATLEIRLDIITGDACRKFHADYVPLRLITSYAGPGSQWLSNDDSAALAQGAGIAGLDVRQLLAGEVALFKGRLLTDVPIIHRSPPIAGSGTRRLVLVINPEQEA